MYKTILVPIDLAHSELAGKLLDAANRLGGKGARIILLNVVEDVPAYVAAQLPDNMFVQIQRNARKELEDIATAAPISAEVEVRTGHPSTAILDAAEDGGADVIVVASHKPGLQDYLLGSTAARVVRHAKCSVFVLR